MGELIKDVIRLQISHFIIWLRTIEYHEEFQFYALNNDEWSRSEISKFSIFTFSKKNTKGRACY